MSPDELQRAARELASLRESWPGPADPAEARLRAAWANAGIEGNPLGYAEARAFLLSGKAPAGAAQTEMAGCRAGLDFLDEMGERPWTPALLAQLHGRVMEGLGAEAGRLRGGEARIVKESGTGAGRVVFKPPHALRVPELLERLCEGFGEEDPFLEAGRFHYEFQSIHPFRDGNGRVGRLASCALARRGWRSAGFHLAPAVQRAGKAYYLALRAVRLDYEEEPREGLLPWLLPWMDMMRDALTGEPEENEA